MASRTGVVEVLIRSAILAWSNRVPGGTSPDRISTRRRPATIACAVLRLRVSDPSVGSAHKAGSMSATTFSSRQRNDDCVTIRGTPSGNASSTIDYVECYIRLSVFERGRTP